VSILHFNFPCLVSILVLAAILRAKRREDPLWFLLTEVGGLTESPVLTVHQFSNVGVVQQQNQSIDYNEESDLDLEYAMTLTDPTPVTVLQTGDLVEGSGVGSCDESISLMSALNL